MAMLFIAVPSFMCDNCLLVHGKHYLYSTLAHFPFFFDAICTQVHCLPINNHENNVFKKIVRILLLMSLDPILVSSVVSVSGPYTELHERPLFLFWYINALTKCGNLL